MTALQDPAWQAAAETLTRDGITAAPEIFTAEADYLRDAYIDGKVTPRVAAGGAVPVAPERAVATGNPAWNYISLTDPVLNRLVLHPDLLGVIAQYYGRQPYLRRMPYVKRTQVQTHHAADISAVYHIDQGKHFVSIMLLLSDLTDTDSHMRYLVGTHKLGHAEYRLKSGDANLREIEQGLEEQYPVYRLTGQKGTMFIYDNGSGIHKGNMIAGTTRDVMQATWSRGDHTTKPTDRDLLPEALKVSVSASSPLIRESVTQIL